jgi:hypothetical protein
MNFIKLYEQTMQKYDDGSLAENIAYDIAYKVNTEKMPLIVAPKPHDDAYGYWNYESKGGQERHCQFTVHIYKCNVAVTVYITKKGSNLEYDEYHDIPHTKKDWKFKKSSSAGKVDEIGSYINSAILADKKGNTVRE